MVSRLWKSSAVDELIEKATSELIPSGQDVLVLQLDVCDSIRSNKTSAKEAMLTMKKRLGHKNPNVQLLTLALVDTCAKNCGRRFVKEVAARTFMDDFVAIVRGSATNVDVRQKALGLVKVWGTAAKDDPALGYIADIYALLRAEGHAFPAVQLVDASLFESKAAPEWTDSDVCERCRSAFSLTNRKHHCRNCGRTHCQPCSSRTLALPHLAINEPVRVCDGCFAKLREKKVQPALPVQASGRHRDHDADMDRAIALSLQPNQQHKQQQPLPRAPEDDRDLIAAVAASLRDMEVSNPPDHNPAHVQAPQQPFQSDGVVSASPPRRMDSNAAVPSAPDLAPPPSSMHQLELTCQDMENIQLFATLMDHQPAVLNDEHTQRLYTQVHALQPKMVHTLEDTIHKHRAFVELHEKIHQAIRQYDRCLSQRMASMYAQHPYPYPSASHPLPSSAPTYQHVSGAMPVSSTSTTLLHASPASPMANAASNPYPMMMGHAHGQTTAPQQPYTGANAAANAANAPNTYLASPPPVVDDRPLIEL
ncbi:hypothetical protein BC940DRAFT_307574 [Gongronella butleri]|nr:hypothetical protein BC940DRAFT_307574 [Gongronella butleri]